MKELMNLNLFSLLQNPEKLSFNQLNLKFAYEEFAMKLLEKLQKESDKISLYYNLGFIKLELIGVCSSLSSKEKKKYNRNC